MANKPTRKSIDKQPDARRIALEWHQRGILPIPVKNGDKRPIGKKWQTQRLTPETIPQVFKPSDNVGGLWGKPSNDHVDVDLDSPIAVALAKNFLPATLTYGRKGNPTSHYIYKCVGAENLRCRLKSEGMVIELRGTGFQSVLPPSLHPSGERYRIENEQAPMEVSYRMLRRWVYEIGAAASFVANYPDEGGRHDYVHAVTGALMHSGWNDEHVEKFMLAVLGAIDGREDDIKQRETTIKNTIKRFREGGQIMGWPTLETWIGRAELSQIRTWLDVWKNFDLLKKPPIEIVERSEKVAFDGLPDLGEIPGIVGDLARWHAKRAYQVQPSFDLCAALMCTAIASQNRYLVDGWDTPLQPYYMLLAPPGGGKDSVVRGVQAFAHKLAIEGQVYQGFQSYHSLLDTLAVAPHAVCWLWDEAARKLKNANRSQGGPDNQVITWLLDLYGKGNSHVNGISGRKNNIAPIDKPFFTVLAAAQPDQMMDAISNADLSTGLISRFVLFDAGKIRPAPNDTRSDIFPSRVLDWVEQVKKQPLGVNGFSPVRLAPTNVFNQFRTFRDECASYSWEGGDAAVWIRANQNALIMAGLVAIGVDPKKPMITEEGAAWAIDFVRWSTARLSDRIAKSSSRNITEGASKKIEELIRNARMYSATAAGSAQQKMLQQGQMPRSVLMRLSRHLKARELDEVLQQLLEAQVIHSGEHGNSEVYWPAQ